jgi:hypothetical protein
MFLIVYIIYNTGSCPEGWQHFPNACYYKSNEKRSYSEALKFCRQFNGALVNINSEEENNFVYDTFVSKPTYSRTFIGVVREKHGSTTFVTNDGKPQTYFKWGEGEPNNAGGYENCVEMKRKGMWNDLPCGMKLPFICKSSKYQTTNIQ